MPVDAGRHASFQQAVTSNFEYLGLRVLTHNAVPCVHSVVTCAEAARL